MRQPLLQGRRRHPVVRRSGLVVRGAKDRERKREPWAAGAMECA